MFSEPTTSPVTRSGGYIVGSGVITKLDCDGSATIIVGTSSPVEACWLWRRNAAKPASNNGESAGNSGSSPSTDGESPTADSTLEANGVSTDSGADSTSGTSCTVDTLTAEGRDATSTTDTSPTAGVFTGSGFGCTATLASAADSLLLTSLSEGVLTTDRFGLFGVTVPEEVCDPDFLSLTVAAVDFVSNSGLALASVVDPASSPNAED